MLQEAPALQAFSLSMHLMLLLHRHHCAALDCPKPLRADSESSLLAIKKFLVPLPSDLIKAHQTRLFSRIAFGRFAASDLSSHATPHRLW
jgi:hypothetical protein